MDSAAAFCTQIADKCFAKPATNTYRLILLSIATICETEAQFYNLTFYRITTKDQLPLKTRYALCQKSTSEFLEMEPTIFKINELMMMCEELTHFLCFRQCHINLLKSFGNIDEDENVDWFDRVQTLDTNILALINDSDVAARLIFNEDNPKSRDKVMDFQLKNGTRSNTCPDLANQYVFSWFNHLHLREISVRSEAAMEVLKMDKAFLNLVEKMEKPSQGTGRLSSVSSVESNTRPRRRLQPQSPTAEGKTYAKRISLKEETGVLADANLILRRKKSISKTKTTKKTLFNAQTMYSTEVEDVNYSAPFADGKTFTDLNCQKVRERGKEKKRRERDMESGSRVSIEAIQKLPGPLRKKIRIICRKMMARGREISNENVINDDILNKVYPVEDDENSDDDSAPRPFIRTENLETLRKLNARKFGKLDIESGVKKVLWYQNAKTELLTARAVASHCVKINGDSSEPFCEYEEYLGRPEYGSTRNRMIESKRKANNRPFNLKKDLTNDDSDLIVMNSKSFDDWPRAVNIKKPVIGVNSLILQNLRRKCINELLILSMIIQGQQQLQDGNVIRCIAYLMLIEYKFACIAQTQKSSKTVATNFDPYLMHLYKSLLSKFRLYATDLFGYEALNPEETVLISDEMDIYDLNKKCFQFASDTKALFFCICVKGRAKPFHPAELLYDNWRSIMYREDIEKQHEFFFGLDSANQTGHLNAFWRTECQPILSGLIHAHSHFLLNKIDAYDENDLRKEYESIKELSPTSRSWFYHASKMGVIGQRPSKTPPPLDDEDRTCVPMLFQLPSRVHAEFNTENMENLQKLSTVYRATSDFARLNHHVWNRKCTEDPTNKRKTDNDYQYREDYNMTLFGETIEKDVFMVAVYKGNKLDSQETRPEFKSVITSRIRDLCREIRSQAAFSSIHQFAFYK